MDTGKKPLSAVNIEVAVMLITCIFTFVFTAYCLRRYTNIKPGLNSNVLETLPLYLFFILKITPTVLGIFPS